MSSFPQPIKEQEEESPTPAGPIEPKGKGPVQDQEEEEDIWKIPTPAYIAQETGLTVGTVRRNMNLKNWWTEIDVNEPNATAIATYFARVFIDLKYAQFEKKALLSGLRDAFQEWTTHQFSQIPRNLVIKMIELCEDRKVPIQDGTSAAQTMVNTLGISIPPTPSVRSIGTHRASSDSPRTDIQSIAQDLRNIFARAEAARTEGPDISAVTEAASYIPQVEGRFNSQGQIVQSAQGQIQPRSQSEQPLQGQQERGRTSERKVPIQQTLQTDWVVQEAGKLPKDPPRLPPGIIEPSDKLPHQEGGIGNGKEHREWNGDLYGGFRDPYQGNPGGNAPGGNGGRPPGPPGPPGSGSYEIPPRNSLPNIWLSPNAVSLFGKAWKKERNYTGKPYDILQEKVKVFITLCRRLMIYETQYYAVFPDILSGRAETFYLDNVSPDMTWYEIYRTMDKEFNTSQNHSMYYTDWTSITFLRTRSENHDKPLQEVLQIMLDKLQLVQRALGKPYEGETQLATAVTTACKGVRELEDAFRHKSRTCEELFAELRSALQIYQDRKVTKHYYTDRDAAQEQQGAHDAYIIDRRMHENRKQRDQPSYGGPVPPRDNGSVRSWQRFRKPWTPTDFAPKRKDGECWVCAKPDCRSWKHSPEEQTRSKKAFLLEVEVANIELPTEEQICQYLLSYEGTEEQFLISQQAAQQGQQTIQYLTNAAFIHRATGEDIYGQKEPSTRAEQFILENNYATAYQGELWDTGAARVSTVGKCQVEAYLREFPRTKIDWTPGSTHISFGSGPPTAAIGTMEIENPLGRVIYHILETNTPFLFCLDEGDRLEAYFNNVDNTIVRKDGTTVPVVRKWGHPFFNLSPKETSASFLTEAELRRIHKRFGHPRTERLHALLKQAGHTDVEESILEQIQKFCHECQSHDQSPRRFKFTIQDNCAFNYEIVIDVMWIDGKPVLHVIDIATSFQAARFLKSMSARDAWDALCQCWIHVYQGPPDNIVHDPGTNFASEEFRSLARVVGTSCEEMPVEAHHAIGKIERQHGPLRRAYNIILNEIGDRTDKENILQMAVKAVNDTAGPNGIVPTLLVFGAYPRINQDSPPSADIVARGEAIQKAMTELRHLRAKADVNRAINTRNGPAFHSILSLPLRSKVMVWREKKGWKGPYEIAAFEGNNVMVQLPKGLTRFRASQVKEYFTDPEVPIIVLSDDSDTSRANSPPGNPEIEPRTSGRKRQLPQALKDSMIYNLAIDQRISWINTRIPTLLRAIKGASFLSKKEQDDAELAVQLRQEGIITTPGPPFQGSQLAEIDALIAGDVFEIILYDPEVHGRGEIFGTRFVHEIKGKGTAPYEKSRLVVQGFGDKGKEEIVTQSPTVQRMSQRLILALGPTLILYFDAEGELRDITQAYTQAKDRLWRRIFARLPKEIRSFYPKGTLFWIKRPLYGLAESGLYWFKTYHSHHIQNLLMKMSSYDPCLLYTHSGPEDFGITALQTDDTFSFATREFSKREEKELEKATFRAKGKTILSQNQPIDFNGGRIRLYERDIIFEQKGQSDRLELIDPRAKDAQQRYVEQRARGAYIASTCQPEASYDLSVAAQIKEPTEKDIEKLNVRLQWQIDNKQRSLKFIPLDLVRSKLYAFTDGSFANNQDLSSQLGFLIVLGEEVDRTETEFKVRGNIIHWSSTKCKRVTRSVLGSELYGMSTGFDCAIAISTTLQEITKCLGLIRIPLVLCSDSKSLYDCLVKLGTTGEKRLMIDIMAIRESYENREISEIRRIDGKDNPSDAFTKSSPNSALQELISTNELTVRMEAFVVRS